MNPFDPYFARIRDYVGVLGAGGRTRRAWSARTLKASAETEAASPKGVILKEDTALELGGPKTASSTFLLVTEDTSLVDDGAITLVGPDVCDTLGERLPFGQVTLMGAPSMSQLAQPALERAVHAGERVPGYVARSTSGRIWSRVSRDALGAGFSLRTLGESIVHQSRGSVPAAAVEVLFVTSSEGDVQQLETIGAQVRKLSHDLRRERLRQTADGVYECESGISCEVCPDSVVCSQIREIIVIRKRAGAP
jgi:CO dehydrogenase/acetyl-CoA synthase beta subunit